MQTERVEDIYKNIETDISKERFVEAVELKHDQLGGLADYETAAMLTAHELSSKGEPSSRPFAEEEMETIENFINHKISTEKEQISSELDRLDQSLQEMKNEFRKTLEGQKMEFDGIIERKEDKLNDILYEIAIHERQLAETSGKAEELRATASNLVKGQAGESIGGQFHQETEDLESSLRWWKAGSFGSILLLIGFSWMIYSDITSSIGMGVASLSKVALLLPVSVAVWFTVGNYSQQKKLMQDYKFKADMALSLMGFREVVKEDFPDKEQEKVGEFVIETMDKIYSHPRNSTSETSIDSGENPSILANQNSILELLNRTSK